MVITGGVQQGIPKLAPKPTTIRLVIRLEMAIRRFYRLSMLESWALLLGQCTARMWHLRGCRESPCPGALPNFCMADLLRCVDDQACQIKVVGIWRKSMLKRTACEHNPPVLDQTSCPARSAGTSRRKSQGTHLPLQR